MMSRLATLGAVALVSACASFSSTPSDGNQYGLPDARLSPHVEKSQLYQPLAVGDTWTYTCRDIKGGGENGGKPFGIRHRVTGKTVLRSTTLYEFLLEIPQVPSKPLKILSETMLLANDSHGNLWLHGFLVKGKVQKRQASKIVSNATPLKGTKFDYRGPTGKTISRTFCCIESSHRTRLGIFTVADYEESSATHDYGYARGTGIVEEDHGPNYEVDCLIKSVILK